MAKKEKEIKGNEGTKDENGVCLICLSTGLVKGHKCPACQ